jgi:fructose/tagatose bisphosphate aldolase
MARRRPLTVVVFHDLGQARAALAAAAECGRPVTLRTAPGAAAYAGPAYLKRVVETAIAEHPGAGSDAVIDCGDDPGVALTALRLGWRRLLFDGHRETGAKLADMAAQLGAEVTRARPPGLDLLDNREPRGACRAYLERRP